MALQSARSTRQGLDQRRRNRGVKHDIAALEPPAIQRTKSWTCERVPRLFEPRVRPTTAGAPTVKEPRQFLDNGPTQRCRQLLAKRLLVAHARALQMARDQESHRPLRKRSQHFGVAVEKQTELHRHRLIR